MKKFVLIAVMFIALIGIGLYFYMYKDHRDIASEEASFSLTVKDLQTQFSQNDSLANKKYLDRTIEVYGKISSMDVASNAIVMDEKLLGTFKSTASKDLTVGQQVKIKGRFIGYDDLLEEFKLDQVSVSK